MNAVEIEEAISKLAEQPFDAETFPYAFLEAFGNKETTLRRLKTPAGNKSDIEGAVLQYNNIHIATSAKGQVTATLGKLKSSAATTKQKVKFVLATDGEEFQAEDVNSGETVACTYTNFPNHFGFFLPLAGISTVKQISENAFDNLAFALYDAPLWNMAIIASRLHLVWIATVCGKMKTDFRYSNTMGWNTFPVPTLIEKNKADLTRCAEDILLAREAHFPATIADLYDPENMPENLRRAHERNDEVLERIYIGRRFKNDTERLEKLFELYTKMAEAQKKIIPKRRGKP